MCDWQDQTKGDARIVNRWLFSDQTKFESYITAYKLLHVYNRINLECPICECAANELDTKFNLGYYYTPNGFSIVIE
jgi:hypothetical protein